MLMALPTSRVTHISRVTRQLPSDTSTSGRAGPPGRQAASPALMITEHRGLAL